jgi:galactofuranosylgalactofuranosylrhamnosyl-N-acetylglucosaminyl-diphospho-decaprenol beta-1,5/1,6-galactofuranosyltransferase
VSTNPATAPGTTAGQGGTVRRVLQRVVLPADRDMDVLPLYVDRDKAQLDLPTNALHGATRELARTLSRGGTGGDEHLEPQAILDRHRLRVIEGERVSFGTYFNAFPASYWRMWTVVTSVTLNIRVTGPHASVIVYRSMPDGRSQRVGSRTVDADGSGEFAFDLTLQPFADGGWYWFDLVAGTEDVVLEEATWVAEVPAEKATPGTVTVGITTMNRPDFCARLLQQIGGDDDVQSILDEVLVMEQGTKKVVDDAEYAAAHEALGTKLRIIEQGNIGGSGGFARAQFETLQSDRSTYVLFLDDDIVCEPESILRAATFGDLARRPTIVGGHMFSLYSKARLHSFGEVINQWRFWWESPKTVENDWDFAARNLRSSRWLHRRIDVDFNGWFMCLIPTEVVRKIGLSLPLFIKWDDSEYGVRAREHGFPTVTLPGAAVWHVPWTDKNDALDWQAYFHQRNRTIAALLHSPYDRGGRVVRESFNHQVKHLFALQYSTAELRHRALEDVLAGPNQLHSDLLTKLPEVRALRGQFADARLEADPDAFPSVRREKPPKRGADPTQPKGKGGQLMSAGISAVRQFRAKRDLASDHPEARLSAMDAKWWMIAQFDSVVVSSPDGTSTAWYHRDPEEFRDLLKRTVEIHQRLYREWPQLAQTYRAALDEITSAEQWSKTFSASVADREDR